MTRLLVVTLGVFMAAVATAKSTPAEKCAAAKLKAAKTKAATLLGCAQHAVLTNTPFPASCATRATAAFTAAFAKAERNGGCVTTGDADATDAQVDAFVAALRASLWPFPATTTTLVASGTTVTTAPIVTTTTGVASTTTVSTTSTTSSTTSTTSTTVAANLLNGCDPATAQDLTGLTQLTVTFPGAALAFTPACFTVRAGTQITFSGAFTQHPLVGGVIAGGTKTPDVQTPIPHTIVGTSNAFIATPAGSYGFYCDNHGLPYGMKGAIFVVP